MAEPIADRVRISVYPPPADDFLDELRQGLEARPRHIPAKYFYDERGSALFERICDLPEYYQTRTERQILESRAAEIAARSDAAAMVELGAGAATKTRVLLDAFAARGGLECYVPFDVDESMVRRVAGEIAAEYPSLMVHGIAGDFMHEIRGLTGHGRLLVLFLGGTIGNLHPVDQAPQFLSGLRAEMRPGDWLLLGTDLIKDPARLEAAYNDAEGVTAEFNRNILRVVNHVAAADFDPDAFSHRAFFDRQHSWIEMRLVSQRQQTVNAPRLGLEIEIGRGEEIRTEISAKYDRPRVEALLANADLCLEEWLSDDEALFALSLARAC